MLALEAVAVRLMAMAAAVAVEWLILEMMYTEGMEEPIMDLEVLDLLLGLIMMAIM